MINKRKKKKKQKKPDRTDLKMYVKGFEPSTFWSVARRSIQLSYTYGINIKHAGDRGTETEGQELPEMTLEAPGEPVPIFFSGIPKSGR